MSFLSVISDSEAEVVNELLPEKLLVLELYNIILPPIFAGYIILFICVNGLPPGELTDQETFLLTVHSLAETSHKMGVIQSPTFCSIFYSRMAMQYLVDTKIVSEIPRFKENRIRRHFQVEDRSRLKELVNSLRVDFLWDENYRIVKRVFGDRFLARPTTTQKL